MALCLGQVFSKDKTFRPRKRFEPGTQRFELYKKAQASLKSGLDLRKVVQLPEGENINDWIAVHVVDFFNRINLIYGTVSEYCSERTCPIMSGGLRYEYRWQDGDDYKPYLSSAPPGDFNGTGGDPPRNPGANFSRNSFDGDLLGCDPWARTLSGEPRPWPRRPRQSLRPGRRRCQPRGRAD